MGRHVISVTILGDASDLDRAIRNAQKDIAGLSKNIKGLGKANTELSRRLNESSRAIARWARDIRRYGKQAGIDIDNLDNALNDLTTRERRRVITIYGLEKTSDGLRKLGFWGSIATAALAGLALSGGAAVAVLAGIAQLLAGGAGIGIVGGFAYLLFTTEKWREELAKTAKFIRNDLINKTMKPFYDEVKKLPDALKDLYKANREGFEELNKPFKALLKTVGEYSDSITGLLLDLIKTIVNTANAGFADALLRGVEEVINGLDRFFKAFKKNGDPEVLYLILKDIADALASIGEALANVSTETWSKFVDLAKRILPAILDAFKKIYVLVVKIDDAILRLTGGKTGIEGLVGAFLALYAVGKVLGPVAKILGLIWGAVNIKRAAGLAGQTGLLATNVGKLTKALGGAIGKFAAWTLGLKFLFTNLKNTFELSRFAGLGKWESFILTMTGAFGTLGTALGRLKDVVIIFWGAFGRIIARFSVVTTIIAGFIDIVREATKEGSFLNEAWNAIVLPALGALADAWQYLKDSLADAFGTIQEAWDDLYISLERTGVVDALEQLWGVLRNIVGAGLFTILAGAIYVLAGALYGLGAIIRGIAWVINGIISVFEEFWEIVKLLWDTVSGFGDALSGLEGAFTGAGTGAKTISGILGSVVGVVSAVIEGFSQLGVMVVTATQNIITAIGEFFSYVGRAPGIVQAAIVGGIQTAFIAALGVASTFYRIGAAMISGIVSGIRGAIGGLIGAAVSAAQSAYNAVKEAIGFNSPARKFIPLGEGIGEGLAVGITRSKKKVQKSIDDLIKELLKVSSKKMKKKLKDFFGELTDGIREANRALKDAKAEYKDWLASIGADPGYKGLQKVVYLLDIAKANLEDAIVAVEEIQQAIDDLTPSAFQAEWDRLRDSISDLESDIASLQSELDLLVNGPSSIDLLADAWRDAARAVQDAESALASWNEQITDAVAGTERFYREAYDNAKEYLDDLKSQAESWANSVSSTVNGVLDFGAAAESTNFLRTLQRQAEAARKFAEEFARIQDAGASQALLEQISNAGVEGGLAILEQLSSPAALREANALVADVAAVAEQLGASSSKKIYGEDIRQAQDALDQKTADLTKFYGNQVDLAKQAQDEAFEAYKKGLEAELKQKELQLAAEEAALLAHLEKEKAARVAAAADAAEEAEKAWQRYFNKLEKQQTKALLKWVDKQNPAGEKAGKKWGKAFKRAIKNEIEGVDIGGGIASTSANGKNVIMAIKAYERANGAGWRK